MKYVFTRDNSGKDVVVTTARKYGTLTLDIDRVNALHYRSCGGDLRILFRNGTEMLYDETDAKSIYDLMSEEMIQIASEA